MHLRLINHGDRLQHGTIQCVLLPDCSSVFVLDPLMSLCITYLYLSICLSVCTSVSILQPVCIFLYALMSAVLFVCVSVCASACVCFCHTILTHRLSSLFGISGTALSWIKSY